MAMDGLPEGVPPSGKVPEQLLQAAPILKWRQRRPYRGEFAEKRSILGVSTPRAKYRRRRPSRGPGAAQGGAAPGTLLTDWWVPPVPPAYIYPSGWKPLISISFPRTRLCTAAAVVSRSGLPGEAAPAPCREEELPPGDHP